MAWPWAAPRHRGGCDADRIVPVRRCDIYGGGGAARAGRVPLRAVSQTVRSSVGVGLCRAVGFEYFWNGELACRERDGETRVLSALRVVPVPGGGCRGHDELCAWRAARADRVAAGEAHLRRRQGRLPRHRGRRAAEALREGKHG